MLFLGGDDEVNFSSAFPLLSILPEEGNGNIFTFSSFSFSLRFD
jgi:hypothetical protein